MWNIPAGMVVLSTLLLRTSAQLLSCTEVNCPLSYGSARCEIDNTTLTQIGVANFSSSLSPSLLTWTVGFAPEVFTHAAAQRRYYLGAPQGLNLDTRTDIAGCALFFIGIENNLRSVKPGGTSQTLGPVSGTCADALGQECVSDLMEQARSLVTNSTTSGNLQCSGLAESLQSSPPGSCTKAGTWGNITSKVITGPGSPSVLKLGNCNPTTNTTYDVRSVATFSQIGTESSGYDTTPLMTVFAAAGDNPDGLSRSEVHLSCMKPKEDEPPNQATSRGNAEIVSAKKSSAAMVVGLITCLFVALTGI